MQGPTLALDDSPLIPAIGSVVSPPAAGAHQQGATSDGKIEFWNENDVGQANFTAPTGIFVHDVYVAKESANRTAHLVLGLFAAILVCGFAWNAVANDQSPLNTLIQFWDLLTGPGEASMPVAKPIRPKRDLNQAVESEPKADAAPKKAVHVGQTFATPYLNLENVLSEKMARRTGALHAELENQFREGLSHEFYYQRYKAVQDIVAARKDGSEPLLREALQFGKFWMRMNALIGLADMGYVVSDEDIKLAIGDAHHELSERFFARFVEGECNLGCQFVARGSLSYLSSSGRLQALKVMAKEISSITGEFMVAATFDQDERVRNFAQTWLLKHPVEESEWWRVYNEITADETEENSANAAGSVSVQQG